MPVLQSYATPWLDTQWRSQNILLFDMKNDVKDVLGLPHLEATFPARPKVPEPTFGDPLELGSEALKPLSFVPNEILFRLRVILLETRT